MHHLLLIWGQKEPPQTCFSSSAFFQSPSDVQRLRVRRVSTVAFKRGAHPSGATLELAPPPHPSRVSALSLSAAIQHSLLCPLLPPRPLSSPPCL